MLKSLIEYNRDDFTKEINSIIDNNLEVKNEHLIRALWLGLPLITISKLIDKGANINHCIVVPNLYGPFDQYPLTIAIETRLDIEYIKLLNNTSIPPVYKIWLIKKYKPPEDIIIFLLKDIDNFMETNTHIAQWNNDKYNASFFSNAHAKPSDYLHLYSPIISCEWYNDHPKQHLSKGFRSANHNNLP